MKKYKIRYINKCFLLFLFIVLLLNGCSNRNLSYSDTVAVTVDDSKVYLDEMMYHVMLAQMQGELYASFIGEDDYWDIKNDDGTTMKAAMKDMAMDNAIKYELFYELATQKGYTLSESEEKQSQDTAANILKNVSPDDITKYGLDTDKLIKIQNKITLATKYYNDFIASMEVDKTSIEAKFKPDDYKQYDIEYIYANKDQKEKLDSVLEEAKKTDSLVNMSEDSSLKSGKLTFLAGNNTFGEETNLEDIITNMDKGEVTDVVETVKGYYIIKLTDNTSTSKYDKAVSDAIDDAVSSEFDKEYETLKEQHKITINQKAWKTIEFGTNS